LNIKDKNALITGSANRIGREIAIYLSKIGVNIAIHYNKSEAKAMETLSEVKKSKVNSRIFKADLSVESETLALYDKVTEELGPISILINNASTFRKNNLESTTTEEILEDYFVNVISPFLLSQKIHKNKKINSGKIIF